MDLIFGAKKIIHSSSISPSNVTSALILEPGNHIALEWVDKNVYSILGPCVQFYLYHGTHNLDLSAALMTRYPTIWMTNETIGHL